MAFKYMFWVPNSFPSSLPLALSVVSMEVFAPHKMAEIRPRHSNEGVPDPRIKVHLEGTNTHPNGHMGEL